METEQTSPTPPLEGFLRLDSIIGNPKKNIPALIPVCRSAWYAGVADGRYPKPVKLSERTAAWWGPDIQKLIDARRNAANAA